MTTVGTAKELLEVLQRKDDEIRITGSYCADIGETVKTQTTGTEYAELIHGVNIAAILESIINLLQKKARDTAKVEELLALYKCTKFSDVEICLRLNQLDYTA